MGLCVHNQTADPKPPVAKPSLTLSSLDFWCAEQSNRNKSRIIGTGTSWQALVSEENSTSLFSSQLQSPQASGTPAEKPTSLLHIILRTVCIGQAKHFVHIACIANPHTYPNTFFFSLTHPRSITNQKESKKISACKC